MVDIWGKLAHKPGVFSGFKATNGVVKLVEKNMLKEVYSSNSIIYVG